MKKVMIVFGIALVFCGALAGCGKNKEKTIVGKWKEVGGTQTIEFFKDGTVAVVNEGGPALPGDYRFIDDNRIRMNIALFGPITVEISPSLYEITLTNPFGKIERYRKLRQIGEITRSGLAGDYTIVMKMPGEEEFNSPVLATLKEDGTGLSNFSGKWEVSGDQLEFCYSQNQDMIGLGGQITTDTLRREPPQESLRKQRKAKVIERIKTGSILWSKYYFTGDKSNASLEIRKDGTFQELWTTRDAWRIKDGGVEITVADENQKEKKLKGEIEGDTIIFQDGETEFRYVRVENVPQQKVVGKYVFEGGIAGEKAEKELGVFLFNKDGTISYVPPGKRKIETSFTWEILNEVVQICEDGEILFSNGKIESGDIVFDKFGTTARFIKEDRRRDLSEDKKKQTSGLAKTVYDFWEEDDKRLRAEPVTKSNFKKLSIEDEIQAQQLWKWVVDQRKMARLPAMGYKQVVDVCREIIRRWPDSEYAFKTKRALEDIPERYRK